MTNGTEEWHLDPEEPMISGTSRPSKLRGPIYELRAVVTHYGKHENGHYICYRKHPGQALGAGRESGDWWRLSDDDVAKVSEENVLGQGGVFMLFYDCIEPARTMQPGHEEAAVSDVGLAASIALPDTNDSDLFDSDVVGLAATIALPDSDDSELSDSDIPSSPRSRETSVATSVSSEDAADSNEYQPCSPAKPIVVPPFTNARSTPGADKSTGEAALSLGNLVMV